MEAINRDNIMEALKAREHELCAAGVESVSKQEIDRDRALAF